MLTGFEHGLKFDLVRLNGLMAVIARLHGTRRTTVGDARATATRLGHCFPCSHFVSPVDVVLIGNDPAPIGVRETVGI